MSRFYDRILQSSRMTEDEKNIVQQCTLIDIDNVARYYFEGSTQENWSFRDDFPNIAPPLPAMFFEFKAPRIIVSDKFGITEWAAKYPGLEAFGIGMWAHDADPATTYNVSGTPLSGIRWFVETLHFIDIGKRAEPQPLLSIRFPVDVDGMWYSADGGKSIVLSFVPRESGLAWAQANNLTFEEYVSSLGEECKGMLYPVCLALSFMHCKNVVQRLVKPEDWMVKNAQKKRRPIPVTYRVLDIEPMKTVLHSEGQSEKTGLKKALHICRGHFKTYDEKPLFGRVKGTFWWPSTVRGSLSEGAVVKDYRVHEPKPKNGGEA